MTVNQSAFLSQTSEDVAAVLAAVRVSGAVLSVARLEAPFAVTSGLPQTGVFHAVLSGSAWSSTADCPPVRLDTGAVAVFPSGAEHVIASDPEPVVPLVPVSASEDGPLPTMRIDNGGSPTEILCGTISFDESPVMSMVEAFPDMVIAGDDLALDWVRATIDLMAGELRDDMPASSVVAARLADVLVVRTLRELVVAGRGSGWVAGLHDPHIASALRRVHTQPADDNSVAALARVAAMSRSSFYARFSRIVGMPPGEYVARWRVHVACSRLREGTATVSDIARSVGFTTDAGFSTAFKRLTGESPSGYRRRVTVGTS